MGENVFSLENMKWLKQMQAGKLSFFIAALVSPFSPLPP
jgi:hypothetical protein